MQKLNLTSLESNQIPTILKSQLEILPEGEILFIEDKINRDTLLEKFRDEAFNALRWSSYMETQNRWVAQVRKMPEENCCGGCCGE